MCMKNEQSNEPVAVAPRSPWRRLFKESLKPKLTRKVVNSARVNLNKYWNKFEELATAGRPLMSLEINHNRRCDNEMNDNTINERLDLLM